MLKLRRDSKSMTNVTLWCGNEHEKKTCVHKLMQSTYLWVCVLILQMLEGCKLVLTTIGISATFPNSDSCHTFVYIYVCLTPHGYIVLCRILSLTELFLWSPLLQPHTPFYS